MSFLTAVRRALRKYAMFSGRASRPEFWWFLLFLVMLDLALGTLEALLGVRYVQTIAGLLLILPTLAVTVRRLHDIGRSGWWLLVLNVTPVVGALVVRVGDGMPSGLPSIVVQVAGVLIILGTLVVALSWTITKGVRGPNRFGDDPLQEASARD